MLAKPKSFSWSYSKLKNFETCPRRYQAVDVEKTAGVGEKSEAIERGEELHDAMKNRVAGSTPLPAHFIYMESWAKKLTREIHPYQIIQCELKLSVDKDGNPTGYFDKTTWLRTKIDYLCIVPTKPIEEGHIVDYKTGRPPRVWDDTQLLINAHLVFAHYKTLGKLRVDYLWTEYNDTNREYFQRAETPKVFNAILPRVDALEVAHLTNVFPPKPCGLCENYCPVTTCEHNGKRMGR